MNLFEEKPRWPGAPPICIAANLPAFPSKSDLDAFLRRNGPSCKVVRAGVCGACNHWHAETIAPDPAGGSSGNGRSSKS